MKLKECSGKIRYRDKQEADQRKQMIKKRRDVNLRVYECPRCRGYHLTSIL